MYYDRDGNTLTVWFGDPKDEAVCEETGEEVVLMKDGAGPDALRDGRRVDFRIPKVSFVPRRRPPLLVAASGGSPSGPRIRSQSVHLASVQARRYLLDW